MFSSRKNCRASKVNTPRDRCRPQLEALEDRCLLSAAGALDLNFGSGGMVTTDFSASDDWAWQGIAVQPNDGKIVLAGYTQSGATGYDFGVARYNANGTLDDSFGTDTARPGRVTIDFGSPEDYGVGVTLQPNGQILVVGKMYNDTTGHYDFAVARLNNDGTRDTGFGPAHDGLVAIGFDGDGTVARWTYRAFLQEDKIVVTGAFSGGFALVRLNNDGSVDNSYGADENGRVLVLAGGEYGQADAAMQPDGKIVIAVEHGLVHRLDRDGLTEDTFSGQTLDFSPYHVTLDAQGNVLVGGRSYDLDGANDFVVARLHGDDGSLDTSFGTGGEARIDFTNHEALGGLAVQADGRIIVVGPTWPDTQPGPPYWVGARLTTNGDLDTSFGSEGRILFGIDEVANVAVQPDGSILIPGTIFQPETDYDFALVRLHGFTDTDDDGIADSVDTQPTVFSNDFSDGTTTGTITDRGDQTISIVDAPNPADGLLITAGFSGGSTPATISVVNGAATLSLNSGDQLTVTQGSVILNVLAGTVEATFVADSSQVATTSLAAGNALTFQPESYTFIAPETNTQTVQVVSGGAELSVSPGETIQPAPIADAGGPYVVAEGGSLVLSGAGSSDPDQASSTLTYHWDLDNDGNYGETGIPAQHGDEMGVTPIFIVGSIDGLSAWPISLRVIDNGNLTDTKPGTITITNVAPTVGAITAPVDPVPVNTVINVSADFTDVGIQDTHSAVWDWGDCGTSPGTVTEINGSGSVSGSHSCSVPGVYTVKLSVTDDDTGIGTSPLFQYIVVYDPSAGFVTGGGWIDSPLGAYAANPALTGKANFGFVAKYRKGANTPTGNTEFQFKAGDFNFRSTDYQWLVVAGSNAKFKGTGTVNGQAGFQFMITAHDGQVKGADGIDKFRIKVSNTGGVVYDNQDGESDDNQAATALGGGSIVIHKGGSNLVLDAVAGGAAYAPGEGVSPRFAPQATQMGDRPLRLDDSRLSTAVVDAVGQLAAQGLSPIQIHQLQEINVVWADLPGNTLGLASESTNYVWIDRDAAGYGWSLNSAAPQVGRVDLFSTLTHEFGHLLGYDHDVLGESLRVGERHVAMLSESRDRYHTELGTPWTHLAGVLTGTLRLFGPRSNDALIDGGPGRSSLRAEINELDQALADWSPGSDGSAGSAGNSTDDSGKCLREPEEPRLETNDGLDDDLLAELAVAFSK